MRFLTLLILLLYGSLAAQKLNLEVKEDEILIDGVKTAVQTATVIGNVDDFKDIYRNFCKKEIDVKVSRKGDKLTANKVVVNQITDKRGDLILYLYPVEDKVTFNLAFKLGYDVYINSRKFPEEAKNLRDFTTYFLSHYYYDYLDDFIDKEEKQIKGLKKELKSARKEIRKSERRATKLERKIAYREVRLDRTQADLNDAEDQEQKSKLLEKTNELKEEIREYKAELRSQQQPRGEQEGIIASLEPKINKMEETLARHRLMYLEARDRVKSYN